MECLLVSIFDRFFYRFWWIFGSKLGWKIDQKLVKKGIEKRMPKKRRLGGVLEASGGRSAGLGGPGTGTPTGSPPVPRQCSGPRDSFYMQICVITFIPFFHYFRLKPTPRQLKTCFTGIRLVPIWLDMERRHACSCPSNFLADTKKMRQGPPKRPAGRLVCHG